MLIPIDNIVFDVEFEYEPAYDGGEGPNSVESWSENVILHSVCLAVGGGLSDLLPFLNQPTINDIEREVLKRVHNRSLI